MGGTYFNLSGLLKLGDWGVGGGSFFMLFFLFKVSFLKNLFHNIVIVTIMYTVYICRISVDILSDRHEIC